MTPEINERRRRLLLLAAALTDRNTPFHLSRPPNDHWRLLVSTGHTRLAVLCAGAEGIYVLVTADGRILAAATQEGIGEAATLLTEKARRGIRPAEHRWAS
jgi:hypothetical protein